MNQPDKDLVQAYLDGELPAEQQAAFEERLRRDPQLADLLLTVSREEAIMSEWARAHAHTLTEEAAAAAERERTSIAFRKRIRAAVAASASIAAVLVLAFAIGHWPGPQPADSGLAGDASIMAKLEDVHGEVHVLPETGGEPIVAQTGLTLKSGQALRTGGEGSFAVLAFADNARFELGTDTTLRLLGGPPIVSDQPMRVFLEEGTVAAEVSRPPANRPMVLATPHAEARLVESRVNFTSVPRGTRIEQERGQLQVKRNSDGRLMDVPTGWYAVAPANSSDQVPPQPMPTAITQARLVLKDFSPGPVHAVAYSPDGSILAAGCADATLRFWSLAPDPTPLPAVKLGGKAPARGMAYSPDGSLIAATAEERLVKLFAPATGLELAVLKGHKTQITGVAFSSDGMLLASAGGNRTVAEIKVWNIPARQELATLTGHSGGVLALAFAPNSRLLATASRDGTVKLWDLPNREVRHTLTGHNGQVSAVAFSPDGATLATAGKDLTIKLWDTATGLEKRMFYGLLGEVRSVAFSPDGRLLAAADQHLRLWDLLTGVPLATLKGHKNLIFSLAFSPSGKEIATAGWDKTIRLWDVPVVPLP
jgi:WD40 repeat protein